MTAPLPLEGVRVIEFSHMVMGPSCGLVLADLGADVIKVEPAPEGDRTRRLTSTGAGFFAGFNRNKKSVTVDLDNAEDIALARRLVDTADVFIENFRPGALAAKGLDYGSLAQTNPRLVYCSLKGFLPGPYEERTALDEVVQMMSGLAYMTGPVGQPLRAGAPVNDMMAGLFGALAVMAALRTRERTGRGEHVQSGLFENSAYLVSTHMLQHAVSGQPDVPMSAGKRAWGVYDVFTTRDGTQVFIAVVSDRQWALFVEALGDARLADPTYASNNERSLARERLIPLVASIVATRSIEDIEHLCTVAGLPYARVRTPSELFDDPHLNAGGMVQVSLPDGRHARVPALPIQFGDWRPGLRLDVPAAGEHNDEVLGPIRTQAKNASTHS